MAFGGLAGDCGPYRGSVVGIPVSGSGAVISYVVPTPREGAIWAPGGPVTGPDGTLYVSVGNGSETSTSFDDSDSVTALSPALHRTGVFAPSSWHRDNASDLDLGSTQPALLPGGMLLADGKSGTAYLVSSAHLGGVGGQVDQAQVCPAFGTAAVQGSIVYEPCEQGGLAAVSTAGGKIRVLWRGPENAWGSPVIGGGAVWVTDWKAGTLYELDQATGGIRASLGLGTPLPHFSSMSMTGSRAYLGTMDGVVSVAASDGRLGGMARCELHRPARPLLPLRPGRDADRQRLPARHRVADGADPDRHRPVGVADPPADRDERRAVRLRAAAGDGPVAVPEDIEELQQAHAAEYRARWTRSRRCPGRASCSPRSPARASGGPSRPAGGRRRPGPR